MKRLVIPVWLCLATAASAEQREAPDFSGSYLCKTTASSGIGIGTGEEWRATIFDPTDESYVVKVTDTNKTLPISVTAEKVRVYTVGVKKFGAKEHFYYCYGRAQGLEDDEVAAFDGSMRCDFLNTEYSFNFNLMRFQIMFWSGYMDREADNRDTPYISIGKCEKID